MNVRTARGADPKTSIELAGLVPDTSATEYMDTKAICPKQSIESAKSEQISFFFMTFSPFCGRSQIPGNTRIQRRMDRLKLTRVVSALIDPHPLVALLIA
jgi:hypothetical protein